MDLNPMEHKKFRLHAFMSAICKDMGRSVEKVKKATSFAYLRRVCPEKAMEWGSRLMEW